MSYIGKTPTSVPLTSSDITDSIISLPKLTDGTDGNLISYDASGNPVAVATGTDGQVLTSTGAGSPPVFETLPAGGTNTPAFSAWRNGNVSLSNATTTLITFNAEVFDTDSAFDTSNGKFTPQTSGKYFLTATYFVGGSTADVTEFQTYLYKNGATVAQNEVDRRTSGNGYNVMGTVNAIVEANGSSDYFEVYARVSGGGTKSIIGNIYSTFFQGYKIIE
jgi:hypothetical protein